MPIVFKELWSLLTAGSSFFFFSLMEKEIIEKAKNVVSLDFRRTFENVSLKNLGENKGMGAG